MEEKLLEVIRTALPEKEVGIVRTVFAERDEYKNKSDKLTIECDSFHEQLIVTKQKLDDLSKREQHNIELEAELSKKEIDLKNREVILAKTLAENKAEILRECFFAVVKVPSVRKNIQRNIPIPQGVYTQSVNDSEYTDED